MGDGLLFHWLQVTLILINFCTGTDSDDLEITGNTETAWLPTDNYEASRGASSEGRSPEYNTSTARRPTMDYIISLTVVFCMIFNLIKSFNCLINRKVELIRHEILLNICLIIVHMVILHLLRNIIVTSVRLKRNNKCCY